MVTNCLGILETRQVKMSMTYNGSYSWKPKTKFIFLISGDVGMILHSVDFFFSNSLKHSKVQTLQRLQHLPSPSLKLIFSWFTWERRGLILQNSWTFDLELLLPYLPLSAWLRPPLSPRRNLLSAQALMDREMRSCRHDTLPWGIQPWWDTMKMSNMK